MPPSGRSGGPHGAIRFGPPAPLRHPLTVGTCSLNLTPYSARSSVYALQTHRRPKHRRHPPSGLNRVAYNDVGRVRPSLLFRAPSDNRGITLHPRWILNLSSCGCNVTRVIRRRGRRRSKACASPLSHPCSIGLSRALQVSRRPVAAQGAACGGPLGHALSRSAPSALRRTPGSADRVGRGQPFGPIPPAEGELPLSPQRRELAT